MRRSDGMNRKLIAVVCRRLVRTAMSRQISRRGIHRPAFPYNKSPRKRDSPTVERLKPWIVRSKLEYKYVAKLARSQSVPLSQQSDGVACIRLIRMQEGLMGARGWFHSCTHPDFAEAKSDLHQKH